VRIRNPDDESILLPYAVIENRTAESLSQQALFFFYQPINQSVSQLINRIYLLWCPPIEHHYCET